MVKRIVSIPGLMGGAPCFEGTRIPLLVIEHLVDGVTIHPEDVPDFYPSLTVEDVRAALSSREAT